jgi:trans-aconitate 2-methyltransferase
MVMPWNPEIYDKFEVERSAPFDDLVSLISVSDGLRVLDIGCGTGVLTARLADHFPHSDVLGIDNSSEMLSKAVPLSRPGLRFELRDADFVNGQWDLIFSHAALQWMEDHGTLIPKLYAMLDSGGRLAIQMPSNHDHPALILIRQLASDEPFCSALEGWTKHNSVMRLEAYPALLHRLEATDIVAFEKVYPHHLESSDAVADWACGTALVPYMDRLPQSLRYTFLERYRQGLKELWPSGPAYFGFKRILFTARRP